MPSPLDFLTLARAAERLKVSSSDPELPAFITAASSALAGWLGYEAHLREGVEETAPSRGGVHLWLRSGAIRRLLNVEVDGAELPASAYALDSATEGRITRRCGRWPFTGTWTYGVEPLPLASHDTGQVLVRFDAGWVTPGQVALAIEADAGSTLVSDLPPELEEATLITLAALQRPAGRDPNVVSRSTGSGSVTWRADPSAVPLLAQQLVRRYRKHNRRGP